MLVCENISKSYAIKEHFYTKAYQKVILKDVNFSLAAGKRLLLSGVNGAGKSTLARIVANLLAPTSGRVLFDDVDIHTSSKEGLKALRASIQYVFQNQKLALNPYRKVGNILKDVYANFGLAYEREELLALLDTFSLKEELLGLKPHYLSGGEAARIGLVRALITRPKLLILDESLASLDRKNRQNILEVLSTRQGETSYIFIAHDDALICEFCDSELELKPN